MWSEQESSEILAGKRVVICEDEGVTQMQIARLLRRAGLLVVGAVNNGQSAVEIVLREKPDLVLMDIRMPKMDGLEAMRLILSEYPVCIVMVTAFSDDAVREQADRLGSHGYLVKPIIGSLLITALEKSYLTFQQTSGNAQNTDGIMK